MLGSLKLKEANKRMSEFFEKAVDEQSKMKEIDAREDKRKREGQSEGEDVRAKEPRGDSLKRKAASNVRMRKSVPWRRTNV